MPHLLQSFVLAQWSPACVITDCFNVDHKSPGSYGPFLQETPSWSSAHATSAPSLKNSSSQIHHRLRRAVTL